jgi:internalin A
MQSCGICFEVRGDDERAGIEAEYIAVDLLPERAAIQTELDALWGRGEPAQQATYEYALLPPSLLRALISRIGGEAGVSALYWREGLCVYEASTGAHALIEQAMDAGWSGKLTISTRGGRARALLERLNEWLEKAHGQLGLRPAKQEDPRAVELARPERAKDEAEKAPDLHFAAQRRTDSRRYVSYAWNDPSDPKREEHVDRLCDAATTRGTPIIRDKTAMSFGDSISRFMKEIGQGDRVFVFLSDKYLKSPYCMFELFEIWRKSWQDEAEFTKRVRLYPLGDAKIWEIEHRLDYADYWSERFSKLDERIRRTGPSRMAERDFKAFKLMQDFAHHVGDILALFADTLLPRAFDDFLKYGFDDPTP